MKKNKTEIEMILFVNDKARTINTQKLLSSPSESDIRDYIGKITTGNIIVFDEDTCSTLISPLPNRICVVITSNKDSIVKDLFVQNLSEISSTCSARSSTDIVMFT